MPTINCGLRALEQMVSLKNVSAFTLIHLAKDNGINLYFCQVEQTELISVARPAIFHQKDHFVFVSDGLPMPPGEYDGYVLTPRPLHEPLPYSLAKKVRGQKDAWQTFDKYATGGVLTGAKGSLANATLGKVLKPNMNWIGPVVTGVASIVNPILGAAVGAAYGGYQASNEPGGLSKNWVNIPVGAVAGYAGGQTSGFLGGTGGKLVASGLVGANQYRKTGDIGAAALAGIGQYASGSFTQGAAKGLASAAGGTLADKVWAAGQGGLQGIGIGKGPAGTATTTTAPGTTAAISSNVAAPGAAPTAAALSGPGTLSAPGASLASAIPGISSNVAAPGALPSANSVASLNTTISAPGAAGQATAAPSIWDKMKTAIMPTTKEGAGTSTLDIAKLGATALMSAPKLTNNPTANVSEAAAYLGNEQFQALPEATRRQLEEYVNTPIEQLATKFTAQNDQGLRLLDEQKKKAIDEIMVQYANYGQDPYTSSEAQTRLTQINQQYDQAKAELQQQMQNQGMADAIKFKQDMLVQSIQQNEFDYKGFMDLADRMGKAQDAQDVLNGKNYAGLQQLLSDVLSNTFGSKQTPVETPAMG